MRQRNLEAIDQWKHFSFHLIAGLRKLPPVAGDFQRGERKQVLQLSQQFKPGNQVCWISYSSTTSDNESTLRQFGGEGTLFKISVDSARDVSKLSLFPEEREVLLLPNSTFKVVATLSREEARWVTLFINRLILDFFFSHPVVNQPPQRPGRECSSER